MRGMYYSERVREERVREEREAICLSYLLIVLPGYAT